MNRPVSGRFFDAWEAVIMAVELIDNSIKIKNLMEDRIPQALTGIGLKWQEICTGIVTDKGIVDTGRLRASLSYQVAPDEQAVYAGTNVDYAIYNELGTRRMKARPFLAPSVLEHSDDYKKVAEAIMKG
jgi:phage gpG-like protein